MSNYDPADSATLIAFVLKSLPEHKQFVLATTDDQGRPWAICLSLGYDRDINIIWQSMKNTEHSKHIAERPAVAVCIASENQARGDFGFYANATAKEVSDETEVRRLLAILDGQKGKPLSPAGNYLGNAPLRLYIAKLDAAWINDDSHVKMPVDLAALRRAAKRT